MTDMKARINQWKIGRMNMVRVVLLLMVSGSCLAMEPEKLGIEDVVQLVAEPKQTAIQRAAEAADDIYGTLLELALRTTDEDLVYRIVAISGGSARLRDNPIRNVKAIRLLWAVYTAKAGSGAWQSAFSYLLLTIPGALPVDIEQEIIRRFLDKPSRYEAYLLGLCTSQESHALLVQHQNHDDLSVREAVSLALAKRGDQERERAIIARYSELRRQPQLDRVQTEEAWRLGKELTYIGSANATLARFAIVESPGKVWAGGTRQQPAWSGAEWGMRRILGYMGIEVPAYNSQSEAVAWWRSNRATVERKLRELEPAIPVEPYSLIHD